MANEKQELVKRAIQNNELDKLFLGQDCYKWGNLKHIPANVPTDISSIIKVMHELYLIGDSNIPNLMQDTIYKLAKGSAIEIWISYSIIWEQYYLELKQSAPFRLISEEILNYIQKTIFENELSLSSCHEYIGKNLSKGLFEDICISNESLKRKFKVAII